MVQKEKKMSPRQEELAREIVSYIHRMDIQPGDTINESALAKRFGVSRTPVKTVLTRLAEAGVLEHHLQRGFFVKDAAKVNLNFLNDQEDLYLKLAQEVLETANGVDFSVAELATKFNASRANMERVLTRAGAEGWLEKRTGYKWTTRIYIRSEEDYQNFYSFRLALEPAAVLEPSFEPNLTQLDNLMREQENLSQGKYKNLSAVELYDINKELHESIISWSGNSFFMDALVRANSMRRILEYSKVKDVSRIEKIASQHIEMLNLAKTRQQVRLSEVLRQHLYRSRAEKIHI
ncbi:MAG: GntR family transcriptional regulator [Gammaproteobacteria bacterium]|jgi:DNA-binding GntR family transcriptional regulator|nr:GntR family transcriptional regulator [Gammaproteobacteria bacterium]